jgi:hypothetical protein
VASHVLAVPNGTAIESAAEWLEELLGKGWRHVADVRMFNGTLIILERPNATETTSGPLTGVY